MRFAAAPCLNVSNSLSGRAWRLIEPAPALAMQISEQLGIAPLLGEILASRGVSSESAAGYLSPRVREQLPDPSTLQDMDKASARLARALLDGERLAIFGDYDVDGTTASAMLLDFAKHAGCDARLYIPDRNQEGYGPNVAAMETLAREGVQMLVTVDCGSQAHEPLARARELGIDVVVTDHHQSASEPPPAYAFVNPRRADDTSGLGHLAGVGVAFLLMVATNRVLREKGAWEAKPEPNMLHALDLVALGTVCDVVPLTGLNRAFVAQGLELWRQTPRLGLARLAEVAGVNGEMDVQAVGFRIGPRLNAGGRVSRAELGVELMRSDKEDEAEALAQELHRLNAERQAIEKEILAQALASVKESAPNAPPDFILAAGDGWHGGVIGIVASRLKDKYRRPSFVISFDKDGAGKGSVRSLAGVDMGQLIAKAVAAGALESGGGHAMAAGVAMTKAQLPRLREFLAGELAKLPLQDIFLRAQELAIDGLADVNVCTRDFAESLERAGPYGASVPEPRLAIPSALLTFADEVGDGHVRCQFQHASGKGARLKGMAFRSVDESVRAELLRAGRRREKSQWHIVGRLRRDDYQARRAVTFFIEDASLA